MKIALEEELDEFVERGFKEVGRTQDRQCVVLESMEEQRGVIYDLQRKKLIGEYPFQHEQRQRRYK